MATINGTLRICSKGHRYYKSSDCPVCPVCEKQKENQHPFSFLGAPARRAMENNGITSLEQLSQLTEKEILQWHGLGPSTLPKIRAAMQAKGLKLRK